MPSPSLDMPLTVGDRVTVFDDVDLDSDGAAMNVVYEGRVEQYVPATGKLEMSKGDVSLFDLYDMIEEAEGYQVISV